MAARKPWFRYVLRLVVAAVLLAMLMQRIQFGEVWLGIREAGLLHLWWATGLFLAVRWVAALQLHAGLTAMKVRIRIRSLFGIQLISNFYSLVLPGDVAGGAVVWYRLFRESGKAYETVLLVGFFRLLNSFTLILVGAVATGFDRDFANPRLRTVIFVSLILIALSMLPFFSNGLLTAAKRLLHPLLRRLPALAATRMVKVESAVRFFATTHSAASVSFAVLLSLLQHIIGIGWMYGLARAFGLDVSIFVIGWIRTLLSLLQIMPITVAGLGVREASLVYLLGIYGVPQALALAYSLSLFAVNLAGGLAGALCEVWMPSPAAKGPLDREHDAAH